ncbi:MAG: starch synthase [Tenericutes bacterium HGW-Tenericutes-5]|jgi:starch synthase|nr:MAG: starch synthase [Tenericutes bacterium HGW-Tenericutes-5]
MLNVLHVSAECSPFVKIGGLADVVGSLPNEIKRLKGNDVRVILPFYKSIPKKYKDQTEDVLNFKFDFEFEEQYVGVKSLKRGNILYYFIDNEFYFGSRDNVYNYGDEFKRFAYFQLAVLESLKHLDFPVDIIHVHDWHTAMIPLLLEKKYKSLKVKTVLSLHNMAYQGVFPLQDYKLFNIDYDTRFEFEGNLNFLKTGIVSADIITTVSPNYAQEILTDYYGYGMQNLLKQRGSDVIGVLNGVDYNEFSPENDKLIPKKFSLEDYKLGKLENKKALFKRLAIDFPLDRPVISLISRLVNQKGIDLIERVFDEMLEADDFSFILLGNGEASYENYFKELEIKFPTKVKTYIGYSNELAHLIYAASDMFLMPSKFEPCGLGQIIALKYGTIPIVRETGGLVDTIEPYNEYEKSGNGFSFANFNAHDMMHVIRYAIHIYKSDKSNWNRLINNAMSSDFSWKKSALIYKGIYKDLMRG